MKRYITIFCSFFVLFSCTKLGKKITVKGRVVNPITGIGIPDVELKLLRTTAGLPGGFKSVKETRSDEKGNFEISKFGLNKYLLACRIPQNYYGIGWFSNGVQLNTAAGDLGVTKRKTPIFMLCLMGIYKLILKILVVSMRMMN